MSSRGSYDQIFKEEYIKSALEALEITSPEHINKIKQMVEHRFTSTNMTIYNSVNHTYKSVPSTKFWYEGPKSLILNEEGTLFWKTSIKKSTSSAILINDIDLRQVYKAGKNEAAAIGDNLTKDRYERSEMLTKLLINGSDRRDHFQSDLVA